MKHLFILLLILFLGNKTFSQTDIGQKIIGKWKIQKMIAEGQTFTALSNREKTKQEMLKQQKDFKKAAWTKDDNADFESMFPFYYSTIAQLSYEFKADGKFKAIEDSSSPGGIKLGTYSFNQQTMELILYQGKEISDAFKVSGLTDTEVTFKPLYDNTGNYVLTFKKHSSKTIN